jgi:hypothetical protein
MLISYGFVAAQTPGDFEKERNAQYERNIKKERINGVYIPKDLMEAFDELISLSDKESIEKFTHASEDTIARKLHFGLGRWMNYNWKFYEGSRFSHYLKQLGVSHPDDMVQFVIVSFHRHLNQKDLRLEERAEVFKSNRKQTQKQKLQAAETISKTTVQKQN